MATLLAEFLRDLAGQRRRLGVVDCLLAPSDWIARARGIDPAAPWRGSYNDEPSCQALLRARGGLYRHMDDALRACGITQCAVPAAGDVGLVWTIINRRERPCIGLTGAICAGVGVNGASWAIMTPDVGLLVAGAPAIRQSRVWRVLDA